MIENKNNKFVFGWSVCFLILFVVCLFGVGISLRGSHAYMGDGVTGSLTAYSVIYNSNYPDGVMLDETEQKDQQATNFNKLLDNMFLVPDGYKFVGWYDIDGVRYTPGSEKFLKSDVILYAEWIKDDEDINDNGGDETDNKDDDIDEDIADELSGIAYGDVNLNGLIDEDDYKMVLSYVDGNAVLDDIALINADVNVDKNIDLVDVDIIKNAFLEINGYVGFLPEKPILIYDIYEGNIDINNGQTDGDDTSNSDNDDISGDSLNNAGNSSLGSGGSGSSGNGSVSGSGSIGSSNGTTSGNVNSSNDNGNSSNSQSNGGTNNDKLEEENNDEETLVLEKKIFKFKYMNGLVMFDSTTCETVDGSCLIVLPSKTPVKDGYTFKGWGKKRDCKGKDLIVSSVLVDSGDTYYACYLKDVDSEEEGNKYYVWIIVFLISGLSLRLIWHVIYKFRHEEDNDEKMKWLK